MNALLSSLWEKLNHSKRYRESFTGAVVKRMLPLQIRMLRKQRDWSQERLAQEAKLTQGVISRAEDPEYGNLTINTLTRIAAGFDCAFLGRFVSFSELGKWYVSLSDEKALGVPSFPEDHGFSAASQNRSFLVAEATSTWPENPVGQAVTPDSVWPIEIQGLLQQTEKIVGMTQTHSVMFSQPQSIPKKGPHLALRTTASQYLLSSVTTASMPYTDPLYTECHSGAN